MELLLIKALGHDIIADCLLADVVSTSNASWYLRFVYSMCQMFSMNGPFNGHLFHENGRNRAWLNGNVHRVERHSYRRFF